MSSTSSQDTILSSEWHEDDDVFTPLPSPSPSPFNHFGRVPTNQGPSTTSRSPRSLTLSLGADGNYGGQDQFGRSTRRSPDTPQRSLRSPRIHRGSSPGLLKSQTSLTDLRSGLNLDDNQYGSEDEDRESIQEPLVEELDLMDCRPKLGGLSRSSSDRSSCHSGRFSGPRTFRSSFKDYSTSIGSSKDLNSPVPSRRVMLEDDDDEDDERQRNKLREYDNLDEKDVDVDVKDEERSSAHNSEEEREGNKKQEVNSDEEEHRMTYNEMYETCCKIRKKRYYSDIYNIWLDQVHEAQRDEAIAILQRTGFDSGSRDAIESVVFALRKVPGRFFEDESVTADVSVSDLKTMIEESMSSWEDLNRRQKLLKQSTRRRRAHCIRINPGADMEEYRPDPRTVLNQHLSLNMLNFNIPSYYMPSYIDRYLASLRGASNDDSDVDDAVDDENT